MLLPLCSLYARRKHAPIHPPQIIAQSAGICAFAILVAMFYTGEAQTPGVELCSINLGLRLLEAARVAQLAYGARAKTAAGREPLAAALNSGGSA